MIDKQKIIVLTGGAGFIGSNVLRLLNEKGYKNIVVADNLGSSDKWKNLVGKSFSDIFHKDYLFEWLEDKQHEIAAFIHLGACSDTMEQNTNYLLENNYRYTISLMNYAVRFGKRFIYASSASTYGNGAKGFSDNHEQLEQFAPLNGYGYSKHLVDLYAKRHNLLDRVVSLKYFNIFGPNEGHKGRMSSAVLKMVAQIKEEKRARLFKYAPSPIDHERYLDGEQCRDFLYVQDAAEMTLAFLENTACGVFNIGQGHPHTWNFLAESVFDAMHLPVQIEYVEMPKELIGHYQNYTCAEMGKFEKLFPHFRPTSLKEAVRHYVQEFLLPGERW